MSTLVAALAGILALIGAAFGAHRAGQRKGREEQRKADTAASVERERESLKAEKTERAASDEISKKVDSDVAAFGDGGANKWLRENADRNRK